jgi:hypothetical protein
MTFAHIISACLGLSTAGVILFLLRKDALSVAYSLWWLLVTIGLVILSLFPSLVDMLGRLFGIHYPPILLLICAMCVVLIKLLFMDIDRSRQERQIRLLFQRLAILEHEYGLQSYYCHLSSEDTAERGKKDQSDRSNT